METQEGLEKIRIEAIVVSGEHRRYVINRPLQMAYTKIDERTIIGEDEGALSFYKFERLTLPFGKIAFGGREFTLRLTDGTVQKCNGYWWDGFSDSARELFPCEKLAYFAWNTVDGLKKSYVFCGDRCETEWLKKLESEYQGKIYDYWEYEKLTRTLR